MILNVPLPELGLFCLQVQHLRLLASCIIAEGFYRVIWTQTRPVTGPLRCSGSTSSYSSHSPRIESFQSQNKVCLYFCQLLWYVNYYKNKMFCHQILLKSVKLFLGGQHVTHSPRKAHWPDSKPTGTEGHRVVSCQKLFERDSGNPPRQVVNTSYGQSAGKDKN